MVCGTALRPSPCVDCAALRACGQCRDPYGRGQTHLSRTTRNFIASPMLSSAAAGQLPLTREASQRPDQERAADNCFMRARTGEGDRRRVPYFNLASEDGAVAGEFIWAALDCPTGYAGVGAQHLGMTGAETILRGRMGARVERRPYPGHQCIIVAWPTGREGRKLFANSALPELGRKNPGGGSGNLASSGSTGSARRMIEHL